MAIEHRHTSEFINSIFEDADLSGTTFRACNLAGIRIYGSYVDDFSMTGWDGRVGSVVIEGVDVSEYVASQLDARFPERVQLRESETVEDFRAMWQVIEGLWAQTIARASLLPEESLNERVRGEWSFIETLRHLIFAVDTWIDHMILGETTSYCPVGMPPGDYPADGAADIGLALDSRPTLAEVTAVHLEHLARVRSVVESVTEEQLDENRTASPTPIFGEESESLRQCLRIVMFEHNEHRRFAVRDLTEIEERASEVDQ